MADLKQFARNLSERAKAVEVNSGNALRDAVGAILVTLVQITPVGGPPTSPGDPHPGLARINWRVTAGEGGSNSIIPESSEGEAIAAGLSAALSVKIDGVARIANSVPYINALDAGSSTQAPAGFVRAAGEAGVASVRGVELLRKR